MGTVDSYSIFSDKFEVVEANALKVGDNIVNIGRVMAVKRDGVFVIGRVQGTVWSLADGTGSVITDDVVWHEVNEVVIGFE